MALNYRKLLSKCHNISYAFLKFSKFWSVEHLESPIQRGAQERWPGAHHVHFHIRIESEQFILLACFRNHWMKVRMWKLSLDGNELLPLCLSAGGKLPLPSPNLISKSPRILNFLQLLEYICLLLLCVIYQLGAQVA